MRFSVVSCLALVGATIAAPAQLETRDDRVITYNTKRISEALKDLDYALSRKPRARAATSELDEFFNKGLKGNAAVIREVFAAADDIKRGPSVNPTEAAGIMTGFRPLNTIITRIADSWIAVKKDADHVGKTQEIRKSLQDAQDGTWAFYQALNSKFPPVAATIGNKSKDRVDAILTKAIRAYRV
jgi:hypothetical protein